MIKKIVFINLLKKKMTIFQLIIKTQNMVLIFIKFIIIYLYNFM